MTDFKRRLRFLGGAAFAVFSNIVGSMLNLPTRKDSLLVLAGALSLALPSIFSFYLPMSDLALHEGVIGLLAHLGEPDFSPSSLYRLNLGHPNQIFHIVCALLAKLVDTRTAVKLVVTATQVLLILSSARLATRARRSPLVGLLAAPLALGWFFYWGLITNLLGLALLWFALPSLVSTARTVETPALMRTAGWFVLLFFAHETAFTLAIVFFSVLTAISSRSWRHLAKGLAPCVFAGILSIVHLRYQEHLFARNVQQPPPDFPTLGHRAARLMDSLFGTHPIEIWCVQGILCAVLASVFVAPHIARAERTKKRSLAWIGGLITVLLLTSYIATRSVVSIEDLRIVRYGSLIAAFGIVTFALRRLDIFARLKQIFVQTDAREQMRRELEEHPYIVLGSLLFVAYWLAPFNWKGATLLYERALAPSILLLGIGLAPRDQTTTLMKLVLVVLPITTLATGIPQFVESSRIARELQPIIEQLPRGQAVAMIQFDPHRGRGQTFAAQTIAMRALAEKGGRTGLQLTDSPISIVTMNPKLRWERVAFRLWINGADLRLPHDMEMFSYVLIHVSEPMPQLVLRLAMAPYAQHIKTSGEWTLFKSLQPTRAIDLPELPAGNPPSQRLLDLCQSIVDREVAGIKGTQWVDPSAPANNGMDLTAP